MFKRYSTQTAARLSIRFSAVTLAASTLVGCALAAPATVTAQDGLRLRAESNTSSQVITLLPSGSEVEVLEAVGDSWYRVAAGNKAGFVSSQYVALKTTQGTSQAPEQTISQEDTQPEAQPEAPAKTFGMVSASSLNVRSGPGTSYEKVRSLAGGTQIELLETLDGWYRVEDGYVSADYITILDGSISQKQAEIVAYAHKFLGYPYVLGGRGPNKFDCSGLVYYVYQHFGYTINRSATQQLKNGVTVSKENLQPGDLVFFNSAGTGASRATHVGIYIGDGQFLHASSPKVGVVISDLYSAYYKKVYTTARRIL